MKIKILQEMCPEPELTIRCPDPAAPEIEALVNFAQNAGRKIPVQQQSQLALLEPAQVLYAEFVNRTVFIYTAASVYPTTLTLAQLQAQYHAFVRCSKSMVVNMHGITHLKSEVSGRILATLQNGECILISRHYAAALRRELCKQ